MGTSPISWVTFSVPFLAKTFPAASTICSDRIHAPVPSIGSVAEGRLEGHRRHQPRTNEHRQHQPHADEAADRHGHRRQRSTEDRTGQHTDGRGHDGRGDRHDALDLVELGKSIVGHAVRHVQPRARDQREDHARDRRGDQQRAGRRGEPSPAGDALRPEEPMRSRLDIARDQRPADERAEQRRQQHQRHDQDCQAVELVGERVRSDRGSRRARRHSPGNRRVRSTGTDRASPDR